MLMSEDLMGYQYIPPEVQRKWLMEAIEIYKEQIAKLERSFEYLQLILHKRGRWVGGKSRRPYENIAWATV
jgi:hypothetical protein